LKLVENNRELMSCGNRCREIKCAYNGPWYVSYQCQKRVLDNINRDISSRGYSGQLYLCQLTNN